MSSKEPVIMAMETFKNSLKNLKTRYKSMNRKILSTQTTVKCPENRKNLKQKLDSSGFTPLPSYRADADLLVCIGGDGTFWKSSIDSTSPTNADHRHQYRAPRLLSGNHAFHAGRFYLQLQPGTILDSAAVHRKNRGKDKRRHQPARRIERGNHQRPIDLLGSPETSPSAAALLNDSAETDR